MTDTLTPQAQALHDLARHARAIIAPELAATIANELVPNYRIQQLVRKMSTFYRATYNDPNERGVAVNDLAVEIGRELGVFPNGDEYASPFNGTGRTAELVTLRAVHRIRKLLAIETHECASCRESAESFFA